MSSRPLIKPISVITNGNMASASLTSLVTIMTNVSMLSYALSWTGSTPIGTISVQGSNDYTQNAEGGAGNAGTWTTLVLSSSGTPTTSLPITGNTGTAAVDITATAFYALRLIYTKTSGTGTVQCVAAAKVA